MPRTKKYTYDAAAALMRAGIGFDDANALRRISMTLHRWHELECGDSNNHCSWSIERDGDEPDSKPYMVYHIHQGNYGWSVWCYPDYEGDVPPAQKVRATSRKFSTKEGALAYTHTIALKRHPEVRQVLSRREPIADRETGARKRLKAIMAKYPGWQAYVQGDPRGASLYILPPGSVPEGENVDAYYNRGIPVCK